MLSLEIDNYYDGSVVDTLYIGGGTPSALTLEELEILAVILNKLNFSSTCEFTFECNFENMSETKLEFLKSIGVNRLSFGIQTFNKRLLKIINRSHTFEQVRSLMNYAKGIGFKNINVDLIFNLPTQTMDELKKDLDLILSLDVCHISLYSLILEKNSVFGFNNVSVCEDLGTDMYLYIIDKLKKYGYKQYEISNFCKDSFESLHNLVYWKYNDYFGFGLGAHSLLNGIRYENTRSITKYLSAINKDETKLDINDCISEYIMMNLRKMHGVDLIDFENRFNISLQNKFKVDHLLDDLLVIEDGYLKLTNKGLLFANDVFIEFLGD